MKEYKITIKERQAEGGNVSFNQSNFTNDNINAFFESLNHLLAWRDVEVEVSGEETQKETWSEFSKKFGFQERVKFVCSNPYTTMQKPAYERQDFLLDEVQPLNLALVFDDVLQGHDLIAKQGESLLEAA